MKLVILFCYHNKAASFLTCEKKKQCCKRWVYESQILPLTTTLPWLKNLCVSMTSKALLTGDFVLLRILMPERFAGRDQTKCSAKEENFKSGHTVKFFAFVLIKYLKLTYVANHFI